MLDSLYHVFNYVIASCYFCIFLLIFTGLIRQKAFGRNLLGSATSGIFLTCSLGHLVHATTTHVFGSSWEAGLQVVIDGWTILPAVFYLVLRRKYGLLIQGPDMINEYRLQLAQKSAELETAHEIEQLKDDFMGMAGHELRTPLTIIKGYAQLLSIRLASSGDSKNALAIQAINQQVNRMTNMISMLLDVTRIHSHKFEIFPEPLNLPEFLTTMVNRLQITSQTHQLNYQNSAASDIWIKADPARFEQVIINLVGNAIKYSPGADQVDLVLKLQGTDVLLEITDYGKGILPEDLPKILIDSTGQKR